MTRIEEETTRQTARELMIDIHNATGMCASDIDRELGTNGSANNWLNKKYTPSLINMEKLKILHRRTIGDGYRSLTHQKHMIDTILAAMIPLEFICKTMRVNRGSILRWQSGHGMLHKNYERLKSMFRSVSTFRCFQEPGTDLITQEITIDGNVTRYPMNPKDYVKYQDHADFLAQPAMTIAPDPIITPDELPHLNDPLPDTIEVAARLNHAKMIATLREEWGDEYEPRLKRVNAMLTEYQATGTITSPRPPKTDDIIHSLDVCDDVTDADYESGNYTSARTFSDITCPTCLHNHLLAIKCEFKYGATPADPECPQCNYVILKRNAKTADKFDCKYCGFTATLEFIHKYYRNANAARAADELEKHV